MDAPVGRQSDALTFLAAVAEAPYRYDFYQALRRVECLYGAERLGTARRPADEPIRLGQEPDLAFAPASLAACELSRKGLPPLLQVKLFGLLGPNGPLPLHVTEYVRERLRHHNDAALSRFLDLLHHRLLLLFYRAWAQAQPHVSYDRADSDGFGRFIGSFIGIGPAAFRDRDSVPDNTKLYHVGALMAQPRSADGLRAVLERFFGVSVSIEQFVGHWMPLGASERTRLGRAGALLAQGAVVGERVWDRQHKFRIRIHELTREEYESFLPGGRHLQQLVDWVRLYLGYELQWDVRLELAGTQVPGLALGKGSRLGWTTWLDRHRTGEAAADLCLDPESFFSSSRGIAA